MDKLVLRNLTINQIKRGKFKELYSLIKDIMPLTFEEIANILEAWYQYNYEELIYYYYNPLLCQDLKGIKQSDKLLLEFKMNNRQKVIQQIKTGNCLGNLRSLLDSIDELDSKEIEDIIYAWQDNNSKALLYVNALLKNDIVSIALMDEMLLEEQVSKYPRN